MQQLIQLRWIAVVGQVATIVVVHFGFGIRLPLGPMLGGAGLPRRLQPGQPVALATAART